MTVLYCTFHQFALTGRPRRWIAILVGVLPVNGHALASCVLKGSKQRIVP